MTDVELIEKIKNGDERAYRFVYKHKSLILKMVFKNGGSQEDGEDVFQNMMLIFVYNEKSKFCFNIKAEYISLYHCTLLLVKSIR
ncbi:MAG: hypothetical protein HC836_36110 [Richelia sp. RM2_1_2]|nr:hypothetical protein [Richelia sp. RM2_1_2]